MHSTDNLDDGYIGSGKILRYSINKHGIENHLFEILLFLPSREILKNWERAIVNEELLSDPLNINLKYGVEGGWDHLNSNPDEIRKRTQSPEVRAKRKASQIASDTFKKMNDAARTPEAIEKMRQTKLARGSLRKIAEITKEAARSLKANAKRSATMQERKHQQGEKNSQFGTCWVTDGVKPIKIKRELLEEFLNKGYNRGRI
jgi:hypothetical protein